jgi:hypothetical protein
MAHLVLCFHNRRAGVFIYQSLLSLISINLFVNKEIAVSKFKSLQILHTAMLAGMVLFCVVSAVVHFSAELTANASLNKVLQVTILAITFAAIKTGVTLFERRLQAIPATANPAEKFRRYRAAAIIKWALIEIPVLCTVVCFMITRNYAFIALAFALIIFFFFQAPVKLKLMLQLQVSEADLDSLQ